MMFIHSPADGHLGYFWFGVITKTSHYKHFLCEHEFVLYLEMGLLRDLVSDVKFYMKRPNSFPLAVHEHSSCSKSLPAPGIFSYFYFTHSNWYSIRLLGLP